jgi:CPA2 family monovalent cation:H+ antiporter-2
MHSLAYLQDILIILGVSVFIVVLMQRLKLSPVLGYLIVGAIIGKHGLDYIQNAAVAHQVSEFGVVFLLFVIGLELTFERLIRMRLHVFGFGGLQLILTTVVFVFALSYLVELRISVAIVIGAALALSSTAIVLQVLAENKRQNTQTGRLALSVLLMQDFAVVPLLAILPLLADNPDSFLPAIGMAAVKALVAIIVITLFGRLFLRPMFAIIGATKSEDIYIPTTLLLVLGAAVLTSELGLSTAMGAFVAGLLIAETEHRNRVENSIMPFKSLLLGLFFLVVGMSIDIDFIASKWQQVIIASLLLLAVKALIILLLCRLFRFPWGAAIHSALLLSQGGEFAFILFDLALKQNVMSEELAQFLLMVVAVSMAVTPLLSMIGVWIEEKLTTKDEVDPVSQEYKGVSDLDGHVIIAGFGRIGRVLAYTLSRQQINYVAVDGNMALVKKAQNQGYQVYHGDLSHIETLKAVGSERATAVVLTMSEKDALRKAVKVISTHYKNINVIARVEDYKHAKSLRRCGPVITIPSTIETGLQMVGVLLKSLGYPDASTIALKEEVRRDDYAVIESNNIFKGIISGK